MSDKATSSYTSPLIEVRSQPNKGEYGLFAREPVAAGTLLVLWTGDILTPDQLAQLPPEQRRYAVQVEEGLYLASPRPGEPSDYVNHSCDPNAGMSGQIGVVARRAIEPGEEICIDYAMCDGSPYDEFPCGCGATACRGRVTGSDWQRPELQARYAGYFSPYLQRRIEAANVARQTGNPGGEGLQG